MNENIHISKKGIRLIKRHLKHSIVPYICLFKKSSIRKVKNKNLPETSIDDKYQYRYFTAKEAKINFEQDIIIAENIVKEFSKTTLSQNEFDALCSFTYNCGYYKSLFKEINSQNKNYFAIFKIFYWTCIVDDLILKGIYKWRKSEFRLLCK